MLVEHFFGACTALAVGCQMREKSKDDVLKPVDVDLTLLDVIEVLRGLCSDLLERLQVLYDVRVLPGDDDVFFGVNLGRLFVVTFSANRAIISDGRTPHLRCLDGCQKCIVHRDKGCMGQQPPARGLLLGLVNRLARDLAKLAKSNHVIQSTVAFNVEHSCNTILRSYNLGDRHLAILQVLALVDP